MTRRMASTQGFLPSYTEEGSGEPLVLIMGLGAAGNAWRPHVDAWARQYRCLMIDNRGIGDSDDLAGPQTIEALAADVARLMDHLGLRSVRIAGVSMGSTIAQQLMLDRPDLVAKAVLIAPWSRVTPSVSIIFDTLARAARIRDAQLVRHVLHNFTWSPAWTDANPAEAAEMIKDSTAMPFETIEKQARACQSFDAAERICTITIPTLVTLGVADLIIHPHLSRETAQLLPISDVLEFETGHVHHFEEHTKFNRDVLEWLQ